MKYREATLKLAERLGVEVKHVLIVELQFPDNIEIDSQAKITCNSWRDAFRRLEESAPDLREKTGRKLELSPERIQNIKALLEIHDSHRAQWLEEMPLRYPSVALEELYALLPIAKENSDRFYYAVTLAINRKTNLSCPSSKVSAFRVEPEEIERG